MYLIFFDLCLFVKFSDTSFGNILFLRFSHKFKLKYIVFVFSSIPGTVSGTQGCIPQPRDAQGAMAAINYTLNYILIQASNII